MGPFTFISKALYAKQAAPAAAPRADASCADTARRRSAHGSLCVLQTFGFTTSKILRRLGGFPELQIPRFQEGQFQRSLLLV